MSSPLAVAVCLFAFAAPLAAPLAAPVAVETPDTNEAKAPSSDPDARLRVIAALPDDPNRRLEGAALVLSCACLPDDRVLLTNAQGEATFDALPAGNYTLDIYAGEARGQKSIEIDVGGELLASFAVDPHRPPQTDLVEAPRRPQPQYWGNGEPFGAHTDLRNAGVGLLVAGGAMATGAVLAGTLSICNRDGANRVDCARDTRTIVASSFGAAALALFASGGTMVGLAKRRHKLDIAAHASRERAGVVIRGRF